MPAPEDSPGYLLWHVTLRWQREVTAVLTPIGLTHVQFVLLANTWWLNKADEHPSQLVLARHAGTDVKMTSQVVRKLEQKGLLEREIDEADTRARRLHVTTLGEELAERAVVEVERVDEQFFSSVRDRRSLLVTLRTLATE